MTGAVLIIFCGALRTFVLIDPWMEKVTKSPVGCFDGFLKTLKERFDIILNYFKGRKNSGFVEGLNQKIKLLKRRGYGMFNIESLYRQIYLDLHGYEEFGQKG